MDFTVPANSLTCNQVHVWFTYILITTHQKYYLNVKFILFSLSTFFSWEKKQSFLSELPLCSSTLLKLIERPHWKNLTDPPPPFKLMPLHVWRNPHFQSRDFFYDLQSSAAEAHFGIRVVTYAAGSRQCWYTLSTA